MPNTEKPQAKEEKKKIVGAPKQKSETIKTQIKTEKKDKLLTTENKPDEQSEVQTKEKSEDKKEEKKKSIQKKPKVKKTEAVVNGHNLPLSAKYSAAICRFIKNRKINEAISELEDVLKKKKAIPMRGEIAHKRGKRMMSGKYPKKATEHFIKLLKSLQANANYNELEEPVIKEAVANIGERPFGKFGRWRRKRSHIKIVAREKQKSNKKNKEDKK